MDAALISWGLAHRARKRGRDRKREREREQREVGGDLNCGDYFYSVARFFFFSCSNNPLLQHCRTEGKPAICGLYDSSALPPFLIVPMPYSY